MNFLTLLRHYKPLVFLFNEFVAALPYLIVGTLVWLLSVFGLCVWNISLYGEVDPRYNRSFTNAYVHTLYAQIALQPQGE